MDQNIFVNRILNLKKIKTIGVDMDHTLIRYKTENFETLVFKMVIEELIKKKHYPVHIRQFNFSMAGAIRGLVVDSENGNILKLNRYGAIRQSYHGTKAILYNEQKVFYRSMYVDLGNPNYMVIDTSFSIAFCVLYQQLVDLKDKNPQALPSYHLIATDVLRAVDQVHADGRLKKHISENLEQFVLKDKALVDGIRRFIDHGKKIFILTNSEYFYTKALLDYAINPFLPEGETWQTCFEYVITLANKPRFFYDNLRFLKIDADTGHISNLVGPITPGVYQGGNAAQFTDDLALNGDEILYIGDHIYGDIVRLKKVCNWRTALVVEEIGQEIEGQKRAQPIEKKIIEHMNIKKNLEHDYIDFSTQKIDEHTIALDEKIDLLHQKIMAIDNELSHLLKEQQQFFNPIWDRVFRAGAEESFFAYQVDRYACIYMETLADLFKCSPLTYFRANRRSLAHD